MADVGGSPEEIGARIGMVLAAYLIGSIPFGLLASRTLGGVDPRRGGSRNIGATNVMRVAGKKAAILTLAGDVSKGFLPTWIAGLFHFEEGLVLAVGLAAVLGHVFPFFLQGRGGKGVATGFGVFFALAPSIAWIALLIWIAAVYWSGYSSVGALAAFGAFPLLSLIRSDPLFTLCAALVSVLIYVRHLENIKRLLSGEEEKVKKK